MIAPQILQERFLRQCSAAQRGGFDYFIDQDTKTLIAMDPVTGLPGAYGVWVRALRLQRRTRQQRWWIRAIRWLRKVLQVPQKAKGNSRDRS